ncbi:MAG: hypothetical protein ACYTEP_01425 [Planctomycetota bacterium]|jgi:hypothetical protein
MTDWLDDILDRDTPEPVPEGFTERVVAAAQAEPTHESSPEGATPTQGRLLQLPHLFGMATAAALILAVGFWIGQGARPLHQEPVLGSGPDNAFLDLEELYRNREVLEDFDILSDEDLDQVFLDAEAGTWVLDYASEVPR